MFRLIFRDGKCRARIVCDVNYLKLFDKMFCWRLIAKGLGKLFPVRREKSSFAKGSGGVPAETKMRKRCVLVLMAIK